MQCVHFYINNPPQWHNNTARLHSAPIKGNNHFHALLDANLVSSDRQQKLTFMHVILLKLFFFCKYSHVYLQCCLKCFCSCSFCSWQRINKADIHMHVIYVWKNIWGALVPDKIQHVILFSHFNILFDFRMREMTEDRFISNHKDKTIQLWKANLGETAVHT